MAIDAVVLGGHKVSKCVKCMEKKVLLERSNNSQINHRMLCGVKMYTGRRKKREAVKEAGGTWNDVE